MILGQALQQAATTFSLHNIEDSLLEARVLLGYILKLSPVEIHIQSDLTLSQGQIDSFQRLIRRRLHREPTAYIINHKEFYGIDFYIDQRVLIPRPETELLVEVALEYIRCRNNQANPAKTTTIADIGTGCGAIAISLAKNLPDVKIYATDISDSALEVARLNSRCNQITERITFLRGNLLEPLPEPVDLIIANLPYIKCSELINLSPEITRFEPRIALNGGQDGLEKIYELLKGAKDKIHQKGSILLEIGEGQEHQVATLISDYIPKASFEFIPDLNDIKRVVKIDF